MKTSIIALIGMTLGVLILSACGLFTTPGTETPVPADKCHEIVDDRGNILYYCDK